MGSKRVIIVCGGTGGHLSPGIATAQRLLREGIEVELVVSEREIDSKLVEQYPELSFRRNPGEPFGLSPTKFLSFIYGNSKGLFSAMGHVYDTKPGLILAFGGFLTLSYVLAAKVMKVPVVLHEANRKVGKSIKLLSGLAHLVYAPQGVKLPDLSPGRVKSMNMPIREDIRHIPKDRIREEMNIPRYAKVLVIVGGSQGAKSLNDWASRQIPSLAAEGIWPIVVTGPGKVLSGLKPSYLSDAGETIKVGVIEFHDKMHELYSCADLVIGRAGAGTIAELVTCMCPCVMVPYPYAADNHQYWNAHYLERRGGAVLIEEEQLSNLHREVMDLIFNDWMLATMRNNLRMLNTYDSARRMAKDLAKLLEKQSEEYMGAE